MPLWIYFGKLHWSEFMRTDDACGKIKSRSHRHRLVPPNRYQLLFRMVKSNSLKIMPHVQATANTVTVQCGAQMTVKTTTQSIPPVPRSYVTQGELWNSRIHQVLEIEAYRPTTTQCLCHHHTWLREGATSVQSLRLNIMCGRTCYSRQVTAYAANYWVLSAKTMKTVSSLEGPYGHIRLPSKIVTERRRGYVACWKTPLAIGTACAAYYGMAGPPIKMTKS